MTQQYQLSSDNSPPSTPSESGDSHCLPPSWSVIYAPVAPPATSANSNTAAAVSSTGQGLGKVPNQGLNEDGGSMVPRLLIPRLVTGVKQWHLRPGLLSSLSPFLPSFPLSYLPSFFFSYNLALSRSVSPLSPPISRYLH